MSKSPVAKPSTEVGQALLRSLDSRGLTQKVLAERLDVSPAYVSALVSGKKTLSPPTADRVATALAMAPSESVALHRASALDQGFRLDLPEDFDDPA